MGHLFAHYLITRFNVPSTFAKNRQWESAAWLAHRRELFETYTLPSMKRQTLPPSRWLILCNGAPPDVELPSWAGFVFFNDVDWVTELRRYVREEALSHGVSHVITSRLDSDDMVTPDFCERVEDSYRLHIDGMRAPFHIAFPVGVTYGVASKQWRKRSYAAHGQAFSPFFSRVETVDGLLTVFAGRGHGQMKEWIGNPYVEVPGISWCQVIHDRNVANTEATEPIDSKLMTDLFNMNTNPTAPDFLMVMSAPSLRANYLEQTLIDINAKGGTELPNRFVCFDGDPCGMDDVATRHGFATLVKPDGPSGTKSMMWWIFEQALHFGAGRLIFCEDDLFLAPKAITRIRDCKVPAGQGFITFYDYKEFPSVETVGHEPVPYPGDGLHNVPAMGRDGRGMWGSLCLLINRDVMEYVTSRKYNEWRDPWPHKKTAGDCTLAWVLSQSQWPGFTVHLPSLVDHAGFESSIDARRVRRSAYFAGNRPMGSQGPTRHNTPSVARPWIMHPNAVGFTSEVAPSSPVHCGKPMAYNPLSLLVECTVCKVTT